MASPGESTLAQAVAYEPDNAATITNAQNDAITALPPSQRVRLHSHQTSASASTARAWARPPAEIVCPAVGSSW